MITDVVIMAGGVGERLWPASTPAHPKQFFPMNDDISFFQSSILRALALEVSGKIVIITRAEVFQECVHQCNSLALQLQSDAVRKKIREDVVILCEKGARHTAAALMTAVCYIKKVSPIKNPIILAMSSDHVIDNTVAFLADCQIASKAAEKKCLVSFGIKPTFPCTEYGYIKKDCNYLSDSCLYKVSKFVQKPDHDTAVNFFQDSDYLWNSGMLCFSAYLFLSEVLRYIPQLFHQFKCVLRSAAPVSEVIDTIHVVEHWEMLEKIYDSVPRLDVDKVIGEQTKNAVTVMSHFSWTDIGSWDSYSNKISVSSGSSVVEYKSNNNFVYSDIPVVLCGVDNLVVVQKEGKLLVMQKGKSSLIKSALASMYEKQSDDEQSVDVKDLFKSVG